MIASTPSISGREPGLEFSRVDLESVLKDGERGHEPGPMESKPILEIDSAGRGCSPCTVERPFVHGCN